MMASANTDPTYRPINEKHGEQARSHTSSETAPEAIGSHHATHFASKEQTVDPPAPEKLELTEDECYHELGFSFPTWRKWMILTVIFLVQTSMNFNSSLYSNAIGGISSEYGVSEQAARVGAAVFLVMYAFGCELWAPWSEGKTVLQDGLRGVLTWYFRIRSMASSSVESVSGQHLEFTCRACAQLW